MDVLHGQTKKKKVKEKNKQMPYINVAPKKGIDYREKRSKEIHRDHQILLKRFVVLIVTVTD